MSLSYKRKKIQECNQLSKFASNSELKLIVSAIAPASPEPPDFQMSKFENGLFREIGVEITQVLNPNLRKEEAAQEKIIRLAREQFISKYNHKLTVHISFNHHAQKLFKPLEITGLASELSDFINRIVEINVPNQFKVIAKKNLPHPMFSEIIVSNIDQFENWDRMSSFKVPHIEESWFLEIVSRKEKSVHKYKSRFDETWLLLVANFGSKSSYYQFSQLQKDRFSSSPFDRIYIYKYMEDQAIRLK